MNDAFRIEFWSSYREGAAILSSLIRTLPLAIFLSVTFPTEFELINSCRSNGTRILQLGNAGQRPFAFDEAEQAHVIAVYYYGTIVSLPVMYWYQSTTKVKWSFHHCWLLIFNIYIALVFPFTRHFRVNCLLHLPHRHQQGPVRHTDHYSTCTGLCLWAGLWRESDGSNETGLGISGAALFDCTRLFTRFRHFVHSTWRCNGRYCVDWLLPAWNVWSRWLFKFDAIGGQFSDDNVHVQQAGDGVNCDAQLWRHQFAHGIDCLVAQALCLSVCN